MRDSVNSMIKRVFENKKGMRGLVQGLVLAFAFLSILSATVSAQSTWPNPGHPAAQIGGGTFNASHGNFLFPAAINLTADTDTFHVDATDDKVGIGTLTPNAKLEVNGGDIYIWDNGGNPRFLIGDSAAAGDYGGFRWHSTLDLVQIGTQTGGYVFNLDEDGETGIGTTDPNATLHVAGDINVTAGNDVCIDDGGICLSTAGTGSGTVEGSGLADRVAFWNASDSIDYDNNLTWDDTNKRLGVGTTSPGAVLQVSNPNADSTVVDFRNSNDVTIFRMSNSAAQAEFDNTYNPSFPRITFDSDTNTGISRAAADEIAIITGGAEMLRVDDSGNIGIGTTDPSSLLHINSSDDVNLTIRTEGSGDDAGIVLDTNSAQDWWIYNDESDSRKLKFSEGGDDHVVIDVDGNTGIGSKAPATKLVINETDETTTQSQFTQAVDRAGILLMTDYTSNAYTPGLFWATNNNNNDKPKAGIYMRETGSGSYLYFGTSGTYSTGITNDAIVVDPDGKVGIGTTSASDTLTVAGNASAQNLFVGGGPKYPYQGSTDYPATFSVGDGTDQIAAYLNGSMIGIWTQANKSMAESVGGWAIKGEIMNDTGDNPIAATLAGYDSNEGYWYGGYFKNNAGSGEIDVLIANESQGIYVRTDVDDSYGGYFDSVGSGSLGIYSSGGDAGVVGNRSGDGSLVSGTGVFGSGQNYGLYGKSTESNVGWLASNTEFSGAGLYAMGNTWAGVLNGDINVSGGIWLGNTSASPSAGTIEWNGSDFVGYDGASWESFTEQGAGSGGVGGTVNGSGADTRVAFWNSTKSIDSDSDFIWDESENELRIATSDNGDLALQVNGNSQLNGAVYFDGGTDIDTSGNINLDANDYIRFDTTSTKIYADTDSTEDLIIEAASDVLIQPAGRVGVGDVDIPAAFFHVNTSGGGGAASIGYNCDTGGTGSICLGSGSSSTGSPSFAVGSDVNASKAYAVAVGRQTKAYGWAAFASGYQSEAGNYSTALGYQSKAAEEYSTAIGNKMTVDGVRSIGFGLDDTARTLSQANTMAIMGGNVGIGSLTPDQELKVSGDANITGGMYINGGSSVISGLNIFLSVGDGSDQGGGYFDASKYTLAAEVDYDNDGWAIQGVGKTATDTVINQGTLAKDDSSHGPTGVVGWHNSGPEGFIANGTIGVYGDVSGGGDFAGYFNGNVSATSGGDFCIEGGNCLSNVGGSGGWSDSGTYVELETSSDYVIIGASRTPTQELEVEGDINVTENIYYGGNLTGYGSDFAEMMPTAERVNDGDVVCFDGNMEIRKCGVRSDRSVAGVVSERPTIIGNGAVKDGMPVGIAGIVPTKVVGPVESFDLLTTSEVPGHAEKATIEDFGAIIGKAMEPCDTDKCVIKVLVGLR